MNNYPDFLVYLASIFWGEVRVHLKLTILQTIKWPTLRGANLFSLIPPQYYISFDSYFL